MNSGEVKPLVHFSAGAIGGFIGVIVTSPLELLKTRQQSSVSSYSNTSKSVVRQTTTRATSLLSIWREIVRQEGYRSLFKGLTPSLAAVIPSKALFFMANAECRKHIRNICNQGQVVNLTAGTLAGIINAFAMNPFWVIKTKIQLDEGKCSRRVIVRTMQQLWHTERLKGFFRGASASLVGSFEHGVYFLIYEELKLAQLGYNMFSPAYRESSYVPTAVHLSLSACISKIISNTLIYPTEVVRTRLREDSEAPYKLRKYRKFWRTCRLIYREEGLPGLYSGWTLQLYKTIPFTIITFLVYESCVHRFAHKTASQQY